VRTVMRTSIFCIFVWGTSENSYWYWYWYPNFSCHVHCVPKEVVHQTDGDNFVNSLFGHSVVFTSSIFGGGFLFFILVLFFW